MGFGSGGGWGHGYFGAFPWSKNVLFLDLPEIDRRLDREVAESRLEKFSDAIRPSFDELMRKVRAWGDLRDPDRIRTQFNERIPVSLLRAVPIQGGRLIEVLLDDTDPNDPFEPLGATSVGWALRDKAGREYTVNAVHKLRDAGPTIELVGSVESPQTALSEAVPLTGLTQFTAGSATVTGVGTAFLAEVSPGDLIAPNGRTDFGVVLSVASNLSLTLTEPWSGASAGPGAMAVVGTVSDGEATLRPPDLISLLAGDFGIEIDRHEAEAFQRSAVHNVAQWLNLKGTQKSYDIIGKISGYRVTAVPLWRVDPVPAALSAVTSVFEIPVGSGKFYTQQAPLRPRFDDFPADIIPLDLFCFETPNWSTDPDFAGGPPLPLPPDGTRVDDAIALTVQGLSIISTTDLGNGRWRIRVGPGADLTVIASIGPWYADFPSVPGVSHWIETAPNEVVPGEWEFEVLAGSSPAFGASVDLKYECSRADTCGYCRASVLRIEIVPAEVLTEPEVLFDGILQRLAEKILRVVPAHVRIADLVHLTGPIQVDVPIAVQVAGNFSTVQAVAPVGFYYDLVPADVIEADPDHIAVRPV